MSFSLFTKISYSKIEMSSQENAETTNIQAETKSGLMAILTAKYRTVSSILSKPKGSGSSNNESKKSKKKNKNKKSKKEKVKSQGISL